MQDIRQEFGRVVSPGAGRLDGNLDEATLLVAAAVDPQLQIDVQQRRLDDLASVLPSSSAADLAIALFGGAARDPSKHFRGNVDDYYDPENSLLHRVLDRRIGIPISLSILLIEVGRRNGISLHGVGMPGHFLVGSGQGFIDTFNGGVLLDRQGCLLRLREIAGPAATLPPGALDPTPPADIVRRVLHNLGSIGVSMQERRMLWVTRSLLAAFPDAGYRDHVQHGFAAAEIGQFAEAAAALEIALPLVPESTHEKLETQIAAWQARLN